MLTGPPETQAFIKPSERCLALWPQFTLSQREPAQGLACLCRPGGVHPLLCISTAFFPLFQPPRGAS